MLPLAVGSALQTLLGTVAGLDETVVKYIIRSDAALQRMVRVFRPKFALDGAIGSHACSLAAIAIACVWLLAVLSGVHSLTG
jgi:hypothetical protein